MLSGLSAFKLFGQRRFAPLFVLFQTGTFNDNALKNALIALVVTGGLVLFGGSIPQNAVIPIAAGLFTLPFLILCAIAGQIADKVDRGVILKAIKRAELAIMCVAAIGFWFESALILCLALILMGAQSAFFSPTKNAVLPQWMDDSELISANGLLSGFQFFTVLLGTVFGTIIFQLDFGAEAFLTPIKLIIIVLLSMAILGWLASESVPLAPPPKPDLKVDYNPITAIWSVLKIAWADQDVFRPLMGIGWFYGFATILITALPNYVYNIMQYDLFVLSFIQACSTIGILSGSLLCIFLTRKGGEGVSVMLAGIIGVTLCSADLYFNAFEHVRQSPASLDVFLQDPEMPRFMIAIVGASLCGGLFAIPLQAMSQRRAEAGMRARLMAAGAVMVNLSVNLVTILLIAMGYMNLPAKVPFALIAFISFSISLYVLYRWRVLRRV